MRTLILALAALLSAGCVGMGKRMGNDYAQFVSALPSASGANVTSSLVTPFSIMTESASAFSTDATTGTFHIADGRIMWTFPMIGVQKSFTVAALDLAATPAQMTQAQTILTAKRQSILQLVPSFNNNDIQLAAPQLIPR